MVERKGLFSSLHAASDVFLCVLWVTCARWRGSTPTHGQARFFLFHACLHHLRPKTSSPFRCLRTSRLLKCLSPRSKHCWLVVWCVFGASSRLMWAALGTFVAL